MVQTKFWWSRSAAFNSALFFEFGKVACKNCARLIPANSSTHITDRLLSAAKKNYSCSFVLNSAPKHNFFCSETKIQSSAEASRSSVKVLFAPPQKKLNMHACKTYSVSAHAGANVGRKMKEVSSEQTAALFTLRGGEGSKGWRRRRKQGSWEGGNARTHTRTHSYSLLNGYLIPWESDHANPLFKGSENVKKEGGKRRGEQGPLVFLEELKSISIMNTGLSDRKSKRTARGRRTEGWADRGDEDRRALCRGIHLRGFFSASST